MIKKEVTGLVFEYSYKRLKEKIRGGFKRLYCFYGNQWRHENDPS